MSKILLVDADSQKGFPNLALMKLSRYWLDRGAETDLITGIPDSTLLVPYDRVYVSCIFEQNRERALAFIEQLSMPVSYGGTGLDIHKRLPDEIEHLMPDYSLYGVDFSMGFTTRGCIRRCPWCVVPEKEGRIHVHAPIDEFLHPEHQKVVLLDNNFTAAPNRDETLNYLAEHETKTNFNQGLDIRLMTPDLAGQLAEVDYRTWRFTQKRLYFAFDSMGVEKAVRDGIDMLEAAGIPPHHLMFYVLVGFDTTLEQDLYRIRYLIERGVDPYVMRYNKTEGPLGILKHLARWVNWRVYKSVSFEGYDYSDSQEAIQAMIFALRPPLPEREPNENRTRTEREPNGRGNK